MKTVQPVTPESAGLTLAVISGPRGEVQAPDSSTPANYLDSAPKPAGWPCIAYTVELKDARGRVIWSGPYRLGVGHVKPLPYSELKPLVHAFRSKVRMTADEENCSHHWSKGARFNSKDPRTAQLWAETAAKLADIHGIAPKLNDVCHSLLMDGAAFFDGKRFEEWAGDYGYSADSIKAKETFEACDRIGRDLSRALSRDELAGLREWAGNY